MLLYQKNRKEWEKSAKDQVRLKKKQKKRKPKKKAKQGDLWLTVLRLHHSIGCMLMVDA